MQWFFCRASAIARAPSPPMLLSYTEVSVLCWRSRLQRPHPEIHSLVDGARGQGLCQQAGAAVSYAALCTTGVSVRCSLFAPAGTHIDLQARIAEIPLQRLLHGLAQSVAQRGLQCVRATPVPSSTPAANVR